VGSSTETAEASEAHFCVPYLRNGALEDYDAVARQLGRKPRPFRVAARCPFGVPSVIENERTREMPTSFWVTCPSLVAAISRVESTGGVGEAR
jgi:uncharacterized protein